MGNVFSLLVTVFKSNSSLLYNNGMLDVLIACKIIQIHSCIVFLRSTERLTTTTMETINYFLSVAGLTKKQVGN